MTSDEPLPWFVEMRSSPGDFDPTISTIKVISMKVSKGLEFPLVGHMPAKDEDEH